MIIKFLGTSAGWPLPRLGCKCQICSSTDSRDKRLRSSILIDNKILLDAGPDIYHQLKDDLAKDLDSILITHGHLDHILGFHDLSHIYNKHKKINLFAPQPVLNEIKRIFQFGLMPIAPIPVRQEETFKIGQYKCLFFPVEHVKRPTFGIKIKKDKFLSYIPDFKKLPRQSERFVKDSHLFILDGSSLEKKGQSKSHINIVEGIELAKKIKAQLIYFVHIGHITLPHVKLQEFVKQNGGKKFDIAYDGLEIDI